MEALGLKSGEKIKVLNGACTEAEIKGHLPVLSVKGQWWEVEVLRDTGCNSVIIRKELMDEVDFTGRTGHIMALHCTINELKDPLFDLVIENVPGPRESDDPNSEWGVVTAVATRTQIRSGNKDTK